MLPLGEYRIACAEPSIRRLASKKELLELEELHGEQLMMVIASNSYSHDRLRDYLTANHPSVEIIDTAYYYDLDVFNYCEQNGNILSSLDGWVIIHPSWITIPLNWSRTPVPFGLLYSKIANESVKKFVKAITHEI